MSAIFSWFSRRPVAPMSLPLPTDPNPSVPTELTPILLQSTPTAPTPPIKPEEAYPIRFPVRVKNVFARTQGKGEVLLPILKSVFGESLITSILLRYKLRDKEQLTQSDVLMIVTGIAVRITRKDIEFLIESSKTLDKENDFDEILDFAKTCKSDLFDEAQLGEILFRIRKDLDPDQLTDLVNIPEKVKKVFLEKNSEEQLKNFEEDRKLLKSISKWKQSYHEDLIENAIAEYLGREIAYFPFKEGMMIPCRQASSEAPCYLEVKKTVYEDGFAYLLLEKIFKTEEILVLFKGTDLSSTESIRNNLADVSGLDIYNEHVKTIFEEHLSKVLLDNPNNRIQLRVHGHSQGAAHSQHFCNDLAKGLGKTQGDMLSPWQKIQKVEMNVFNPPAVTTSQSEDFTQSLEKLELHASTKDIIFSVIYNIVEWDPVNLCGSTLLGHFRKTRNINVIAYTYLPTASGFFVGPHCSQIFKIDAKPVISHVYKDDRDLELQIERQLKYLMYFQTKKVATLKLAEELNHAHNLSIQGIDELVIKLSLLSQEDLQALIIGKVIPDEWKSVCHIELEKFKIIAELIRVIQSLDKTAELFVDFEIENPEWCRQIVKMENEKVADFIHYLSTAVQEHAEQKKSNRAELDVRLNGTSYTSLKALDRLTLGAFLKFEKDCLYRLTNIKLATWRKIAYGTQMIIVPVGISVGVGVAIAQAPIVLAIAAGVGGIAGIIKSILSWRSRL